VGASNASDISSIHRSLSRLLTALMLAVPVCGIDGRSQFGIVVSFSVTTFLIDSGI
jgi:hypothetical protein